MDRLMLLDDGQAEELLRFVDAARTGSRDRAASLPSAELLVRLVHTLLETSLTVDEGRPIQCAVAYAERTWRPDDRVVALRETVPCEPHVLRKLAHAADARVTYFLVDGPEGDQGELVIWGMMMLGPAKDAHELRDLLQPPTALHVVALAPATLRVGFGFLELLKLNRGARVRLDDPLDSWSLLGRMLGAPPGDARVSVLALLTLRLQRLGHGGTIALCTGPDASVMGGHQPEIRGDGLLCRHSAVRQAKNEAATRSQAGESYDIVRVLEPRARDTRDALLDFVAQLANIDGALVLSLATLDVLRFGARLEVPSGCAPPVFLLDLDDADPGQAHLTPVERLGGTRHQSAALWVGGGEGNNRVAIVVSADGPTSIMTRRNTPPGVDLVRNVRFT